MGGQEVPNRKLRAGVPKSVPTAVPTGFAEPAGGIFCHFLGSVWANSARMTDSFVESFEFYSSNDARGGLESSDGRLGPKFREP